MTLLINNTKDQLNYQVYETRDAMGQAAAKYTEELLVKLQNEQDSIRIIFASAPSCRCNDWFLSLQAKCNEVAIYRELCVLYLKATWTH